MPDMTARTPMTVTTLFRRTTLATRLLLALAGCSVMTP